MKALFPWVPPGRKLCLAGRRWPVVATWLGLLALGSLRSQTVFQDTQFAPDLGTNVYVLAVAVQTDGRVLVSGVYQDPARQTLQGVTRLNTDGSLDATFQPFLGRFPSLALQHDGRAILAGWYTNAEGQVLTGLVRLQINGSADPSFHSSRTFDPSGKISVAIDSDDRIFLGSRVTNGAPASVHRLLQDGADDPGFQSVLGNRMTDVRRLIPYSAGRLLVSGDGWDGRPEVLFRLQPDGTFDPSFVPDLPNFGSIDAVALQPDGRIVIGFDNYLAEYPQLLRLNPDGGIDLGFQPGWITAVPPLSHMESPGLTIGAVALQPDGRILIAGVFSAVADSPREGFVRLNSDGSLDTGFHGFGLPLRSFFDRPIVKDLVIQPEGPLIVGRLYLHPDDAHAVGLIRLLPGPSIDRGIVRFDSPSGRYDIAEGESIQLTVTRDGPLDEAVSVRFATRDGTAKAGADYVSRSGELAFAPGQRQQVFSIPVNTDLEAEPTEEFEVELTPVGTGSVAGYPNIARVSVQDRNFGVEFSSANFTGSESQRATPLEFRLIGGLAGTRAFRFGIEIVGGTAETGLDFVLTASEVAVVTPTSWDGVVPVDIIDDALFEGPETARFRIVNATDGAVIGVQSEATLRIEDNDTPLGAARGANGSVRAAAVQPDARILVAGDFDAINGEPRHGVARLHPDLTLDPGFDPGLGPDAAVNSIAVQPDGKILLGGTFATMGGVSRQGIARLNADGTLDGTFDPGRGIWAENRWYAGVDAIALQADGRVVIGGYFTQFDGVPRNCLVRLGPDGALDQGFHPPIPELDNPYTRVRSLQTRANGDLLVGGAVDFSGEPALRLAWIDAQGLRRTPIGLDATLCLGVPRPDGSVVVGGFWPGWDWRIVRLSADGTLDPGFTPTSVQPLRFLQPPALAYRHDGTAIMALLEPMWENAPRHLVRLLADGGIDPACPPLPVANDYIRVILALPGDRLLVGGDFTQIGGITRLRLATLEADLTLSGLPRLKAVRQDPARGLRMTFEASDDILSAPLVVESSDNLHGWTPIHTNLPPAVLRQFTDPDTSAQHRLYRVRLP